MTGIFRANNPLNASILFIYGILLKLPYFLNYEVVSQQPSDGFLFGEIIHLIQPALDLWAPLAAVITYLLLFTQAMTINYYVNSRKMVSGSNYLTAMSYLLISSLFPSWNVLSATLVVNTFLIWILGKALILGSIQNIKSNLFNMGFVVGICSFIYLPSVLIVLLIILSLMITRPPKPAEWAMVFLGFFTVWYFLLAWLFLTDRLYDFYIGGLLLDLPDNAFTVQQYIKTAWLLLLFLIGFYFIQADSNKQVIQVRKMWSIILAGVIVMLFTPFLEDNDNLSDWIVAILFIAPVVGYAFYNIKIKWINRLLHWSIVCVIIYFQYFN